MTDNPSLLKSEDHENPQASCGFFLLESESPEQTFAIGKQIAGTLAPGSVIALNGVLGSGKTCLTKGIAAGLGINENLTSPTYTIVNEYPAVCKDGTAFCHIDAYRLNNDRDFEDIGGGEIISSGNICVIEWSERIPKSLPDGTITITLEITGSQARAIKVKGMKNEFACN